MPVSTGSIGGEPRAKRCKHCDGKFGNEKKINVLVMMNLWPVFVQTHQQMLMDRFHCICG